MSRKHGLKNNSTTILFLPLNFKNKIMANFYCKFCGHKASNVSNLTSSGCPRHPNGGNRGNHVLYEGPEKSQYYCRYCGHKASSISSLVSSGCSKHPNGPNRGRHEPAL